MCIIMLQLAEVVSRGRLDPARLPCSSICRDKSLLKHYVRRDWDKRYSIVSVPAKSGRLATNLNS